MPVNNKTTSSKAAGSMKDAKRSGRDVSVNRNSGSVKRLYTTSPKSSEKGKEDKQNKWKSGSAAGSMKDAKRSGRDVSVNRNYGSVKSLYSANPDGVEQQADADKSINIADFYKADKALVTSPKSMYSSTWNKAPEEPLEYTLDDLRTRKPPEDRVNIGQLAYGVVDQAANEFVGNTLSTMDMLIGKPLQKAMDFTEEKLGLPDAGVNGLSAYTQRFQENAAREAEYYAQNAEKSELAGLINKYGPDVVAMIPEIALAVASGGTSAAAGIGMKGLKAVSKADDIADTVKIAGRWLKNNPNVAMNFFQTTGAAHEQALSEGATDAEAYAYALLNGGMDAMITKYGVGAAQKGIESLPGNLRDAWKKVSNTVKSADAMAQEVLEGQMYGAMQRASRGIYDENAKLASLSDENAVFNPKAMLESAAMDAISPAVMGAADRRKGTPEPARVKVDAEAESNVRPDKGKNTGNLTKVEKQDMEMELFIQTLRNGDISKIKDAPAHVLRNPKVQRMVREETGVNISPLDNPKRREMMQKYKLASIEMKRKKAKEGETGSDSKSSLEKEKNKTYNKNNKKK